MNIVNRVARYRNLIPPYPAPNSPLHPSLAPQERGTITRGSYPLFPKEGIKG